MLKFLKRNKESLLKPEKQGLFNRFKEGLQKTRAQLTRGLSNLFLGKKAIDASLMEDLETVLLSADVGPVATQQIMQALSERVARRDLADAQALYTALQTYFYEFLQPCVQPLNIDKKPYVILVVGVNGAGKTTTIGKLAYYLKQQGKRVLLAAGDTFRAAAIEQLQIWGQRNEIPVIAQHLGADSASVIYDAFRSAQAKEFDVLIADTAGRLHNKDQLMQELEKLRRVLAKLDPTAPHETMLVLDATTGQNALVQAEQFKKILNITGIVLTKLDGTAKGGVIFEIARRLALPIRFIGIGEQLEDLKHFEAESFITALFETENPSDGVSV